MLTPDPELAVDYGLFSVAQAISAGISRADIERGIRRGRWDRPARGILRAVDREPRLGDELLMAVLRAGSGAVAGSESAAEVHGWDLLKPPTRPQLIVPLGYHAPARQTASIYRERLGRSDVVLRGVIPVTAPVRTALDIAATLSLDQAVVAVDSALRAKSVTQAELLATFARSQRHGVRRAREILALADPLSGSVPESQARMLFRRARLPPPDSQRSFYLDGVFLARTDFYWEFAQLVCEIDGFAYHSAEGDFQKDRTNQTGLVRAGLRVVRFTVADLWVREDYVTGSLWDLLGLEGGYSNC